MRTHRRPNPRSLLPALRLITLLTALMTVLSGCQGCPGTARLYDLIALPEPDATPSLLCPSEPAWELRERLLPGPLAPGLFVIAGLHGYTEPCGCTEDILQGGIDRLAGTLSVLQSALPAGAAIATGDTFFQFPTAHDQERAQDLARTQLIAESLATIGIQALGVGPRDLARGSDLFLGLAREHKLPLVSTNLSLDDAIPRYRIAKVGDLSIAVLSVLTPSALSTLPPFEGEKLQNPGEALERTLEAPDVRAADLRVLLFHGEDLEAISLLENTADIDLLIPAQSERATTSLVQWGNARVPRVWSQGREIGVLRLHAAPGIEGPWQDAAPYSSDDLQRLEELVESVGAQIAQIESTLEAGAESPPILTRLQERRAGYLEELEAAGSPPEFPADARSFLWNTVALAPGLPIHPQIEAKRQAYNRALAEINLANATPPPPAAQGHPSYVGAQTCLSCHSDAHAQWETTPHARAWETLVERDKAYDLECVGCHLTGYQRPGGSALGFTTGLEGVQCESCHGPGSLHARNPTLIGDVLGGVQREVSANTCVGCHNDEHSPRFDFDAYLPRILGPGHGAR